MLGEERSGVKEKLPYQYQYLALMLKFSGTAAKQNCKKDPLLPNINKLKYFLTENIITKEIETLCKDKNSINGSRLIPQSWGIGASTDACFHSLTPLPSSNAQRDTKNANR